MSISLNAGFRMSASGMSAERFRMDVISSNIANANSTRVGGQDPYRRRVVVLESSDDGVQVQQLVQDSSDFRMAHEPGNPNADENGMVYYSNVEPLIEMVDMISAQRAYEANIAAFNSTRAMIRAALTIGKA